MSRRRSKAYYAAEYPNGLDAVVLFNNGRQSREDVIPYDFDCRKMRDAWVAEADNRFAIYRATGFPAGWTESAFRSLAIRVHK